MTTAEIIQDFRLHRRRSYRAAVAMLAVIDEQQARIRQLEQHAAITDKLLSVSRLKRPEEMDR